MRTRILFVSFVLAVCLAGSSAWAQKSSTIQIPFAFTAGNNELPPGRYSLQPNAGGTGLIVHQLDKNDTLNIPALTRLSRRPVTKVELVFDKADNKTYLAEVYFPGMDGFHLQGAPGKHSHTKIDEK